MCPYGPATVSFFFFLFCSPFPVAAGPFVGIAPRSCRCEWVRIALPVFLASVALAVADSLYDRVRACFFFFERGWVWWGGEGGEGG